MLKQILALMGLHILTSSAIALPVTIDFEGVVSDTGAQYNWDPYIEAGMTVTSGAMKFNGVFGKDYVGNGIPVADNDNGSAIFGWSTIDNPATIAHQHGSTFDLISIEASNLNAGELSGPFSVVGHYLVGGTVSTTLWLQQDIWHSYEFDSSWSGLGSLSITNEASGVLQDLAIDNIVVNVVPIPGAAWLFGSALIGLAGIKRKN